MRYNPFLGSSKPAPKRSTNAAPDRAAKTPNQKAKSSTALKKKKQHPKTAKGTRPPSQLAQAALTRAQVDRSMANYDTIINGFIQKGIPADDITPRENVFTFHAWKAKGRRVRKGEHGVKITSWVPVLGKTKTEKDPKTGEEKTVAGLRPKTATVFHITQTEPIDNSSRAPKTVATTPANRPDSLPEAPTPQNKLPTWLQNKLKKAS